MGRNWNVVNEYTVEIWFRIEKDEDGYPKSKDWEQVLAYPVLESEDYFMIESIPFFLKNVSRADIVRAKVSQDSEVQEKDFFEFESIIERGGHNTYRLLIKNKHSDDPAFTEGELTSKGLAIEIEADDFLAVDVPPEVDQQEIDDYLIAEKTSGRWGLQDGYVNRIETTPVGT